MSRTYSRRYRQPLPPFSVNIKSLFRNPVSRLYYGTLAYYIIERSQYLTHRS